MIDVCWPIPAEGRRQAGRPARSSPEGSCRKWNPTWICNIWKSVRTCHSCVMVWPLSMATHRVCPDSSIRGTPSSIAIWIRPSSRRLIDNAGSQRARNAQSLPGRPRRQQISIPGLGASLCIRCCHARGIPSQDPLINGRASRDGPRVLACAQSPIGFSVLDKSRRKTASQTVP